MAGSPLFPFPFPPDPDPVGRDGIGMVLLLLLGLCVVCWFVGLLIYMIVHFVCTAVTIMVRWREPTHHSTSSRGLGPAMGGMDVTLAHSQRIAQSGISFLFFFLFYSTTITYSQH